MNTTYCENFLVLAEEKNIARAAKVLFMSPSTLSKQLIALENEVGSTLFKRDTNPLELTYAGMLFLETAKNIVNETRKLNKKLCDISDNIKGHIKLGISSIRIDCDFQYILPAFLTRYPNCSVDLTSSATVTLRDMLLSGELDLAICSDYQRSSQLHYERLKKEELLFMVSKQHPLAKYASTDEHGKRATCDPEWFKTVSFLVQSKHSPSRFVFSKLFEKSDFEPQISIMNCPSLLPLQIASQSEYCTIYPEHYLNHFPNLVGFSFDPPVYQDFCIAKRTTYQFNQQEQYLVELIRDFYI